MAAQVFISYSSKDRKVARTICSALESRGLSCWISSRDVGPGESFMDAIVRAIRVAKVMVLVFSENANNSDDIKREVVLAGNAKVTVIPVRVEDVVPADAFAYQFATRQWIDLFDDWESQLERLATWIGGIVSVGSAPGPSTPKAEDNMELRAPENPPHRSEAAETFDRSEPSERPSIKEVIAAHAPVVAAPPSPHLDSFAQPTAPDRNSKSDLWVPTSGKAVATGVLLVLQGIIQLIFWLSYLPNAIGYYPYYVATVVLAVWFIIVGVAGSVIGAATAFRFRSVQSIGLVICVVSLISYIFLLLPPEDFKEGVGELLLDVARPSNFLGYWISVLSPIVSVVCLFGLWINRSSMMHKPAGS